MREPDEVKQITKPNYEYGDIADFIKQTPLLSTGKYIELIAEAQRGYRNDEEGLAKKQRGIEEGDPEFENASKQKRISYNRKKR